MNGTPLGGELEFDAAHERAERRRRAIAVLCWSVTVPLVIAFLLRLLMHDATPELIALNALTQWLYLPAWPVMCAALALRRHWLSACAAGLVVAHVTWIGPANFLPAPSQALQGGHRLRVMSVNLLTSNRRSGILAEIRQAQPDLLLVQELSPA